MTKADEKIVYCQVDAHLDTNPKIRRAGRDGRDIFEFLLRRVAIGRTAGTVPLKYIEPWYLADQLMMTEDEARHGTSRAVTARLIDIEEVSGVVRLVGWSEEWGRRPKEGSERTAKWRANQPESRTRVTHGDDVRRDVTFGDESDAREERRSEEKRGEEIKEKNSAAPSAGGSPALDLFKAKVDAVVGEVGTRRARKPKPSAATADERAAALRILAKLSDRNGIQYSGTNEHIGLIARHLRSGVLEMDLRYVVAYCAAELGWAEDPDMAPFLRPETLFGPKTLSKYLDPARTWVSKLPDDNSQPQAGAA